MFRYVSLFVFAALLLGVAAPSTALGQAKKKKSPPITQEELKKQLDQRDEAMRKYIEEQIGASEARTQKKLDEFGTRLNEFGAKLDDGITRITKLETGQQKILKTLDDQGKDINLLKIADAKREKDLGDLRGDVVCLKDLYLKDIALLKSAPKDKTIQVVFVNKYTPPAPYCCEYAPRCCLNEKPKFVFCKDTRRVICERPCGASYVVPGDCYDFGGRILSFRYESASSAWSNGNFYGGVVPAPVAWFGPCGASYYGWTPAPAVAWNANYGWSSSYRYQAVIDRSPYLPPGF